MIGFIDIETGGYSITKNGVCEIAMIVVDEESNKIVDSIEFFIKPYKREDSEELVSYKEDAMLVNGIMLQQLESGLNVTDAMEMLYMFIQKNNVSQIYAHNKAFDMPRLTYLLDRFVGKKLNHIKQSCTLELSKSKLKLPSYSLEELCKHFCIINENPHRAMGDIKATFELYKKLK